MSKWPRFTLDQKLFVRATVLLALVFTISCISGEVGPAVGPNLSGTQNDSPNALPAQNDCDEITISELNADETLLYTSTAISPQLGSEIADFFWIEIYDDQTGDLSVGAGVDENYKGCDHCLLIAEDSPTGDLEEATRLYYATSGTMRVDPSSVPTEQSLTVVLDDVIFKEVTLDKPNTGFLTTEVSGGRCLHLANAPLSASAPAP